MLIIVSHDTSMVCAVTHITTSTIIHRSREWRTTRMNFNKGLIELDITNDFAFIVSIPKEISRHQIHRRDAFFAMLEIMRQRVVFQMG